MADAHDEPLVTEGELRQLPRWALVAFAARCARRVQPVFATAWQDAPRAHVKAVDTAIALAESTASVGQAPGANATQVATAAHAAAQAAHAYTAAAAAAGAAAHAANTATAIPLAGDDMNEAVIAHMKRTYNMLIGEQTAERVRIEIGSVAPTGHEATMEVRGRDMISGLPRKTVITSEEIRSALQDLGDAAASAAAAARLAGNAVANVATSSAASDDAARADFDLLLGLSRDELWADDTPVDVSMLGPLWPKGLPSGWPEVPAEPRTQLMVELEVPRDINQEKLNSLVADAVDRLDTLHRSYGGAGLKIDRVELDQAVGVPTGVPA